MNRPKSIDPKLLQSLSKEEFDKLVQSSEKDIEEALNKYKDLLQHSGYITIYNNKTFYR